MDVVGTIYDVAKKLGNLALEEAWSLGRISSKVRSVKDLLESINPLLEDAETSNNQSESTKHWVEEVRDIAERIEDAIDIYTVEVKINSATNRHPQVADWLHCLCPCIKDCVEVMPANPLKLISLRNFSAELDDIEATMKRIKEKKDILGTPSLGESSKNEKLPESHTFPYIDETKVIVGQDDDKRAILEELLSSQPAHLLVVSIVGIGGLGKTTLARSIFNSPKTKENFSTRIWLSVSQQYNKIDILKRMLRQIRDLTKEEENIQDEDYFIEKIRSHLEKIRYFIVLDDVWSVEFWHDYLKNACPDGQKGNRVLITTRNEKVAMVSMRPPHKLKFLSEEEGKLLLFKTAFPYQDPPSVLDEIATKLVKYCGGLPLALEVMGGILYKKDTYQSWRNVAEDLNWQSKGNKCMKILATSYDYMPIVLKKCFMYFASFPEDYEIDAEFMIWILVAEGLVPDEISAKECLEDLAQRSMILVSRRSYDDSIMIFGVHDLLRDLAIEKAKESKFLSVFHNQNLDETLGDARRVSLQSCNFDERDNSLSSSKKLRSLFIFGKSLSDYSGFRLLKVLRLENCSFSLKGQKWFKELILLRQLEFNKCVIEGDEIPEEIGHLKNLQTLNCIGTRLRGLSESIWSIKTLRHVWIYPCLNESWPQLPAPSDDLNLVNLRTLRFVRLEHTQDVVDMKHFIFSEHLQCLTLGGVWSQDVGLSAHLFPFRLTRLGLRNCEFTKDPMPELGKLENLKILMLGSEAYKGRQMTCPAGGFLQLRELELGFLPVEDLNIEEGTMSVLKKLKIAYCKLKRIPDLQHLNKLEEFVWYGAPFSEGEIQMMRQENQDKLNHIHAVIINPKISGLCDWDVFLLDV